MPGEVNKNVNAVGPHERRQVSLAQRQRVPPGAARSLYSAAQALCFGVWPWHAAVDDVPDPAPPQGS